MGTSAMPVRDALRRLTAERALVSLPNRTIAVPVLDRERIQEIYKIRIALECLATAEAATRISASEIATLQQLAHDMEKSFISGDRRIFTDLNWEFHFLIYRKSQMPQLVDAIEGYWLQIGPLISRYLSALHEKTNSDDHNRIIAALSRGDAAKASAGVGADLTHTCEKLIEAVAARQR